MSLVRDFLSQHWRKLLGIAVGASGIFYPALLPATTALGGLIAGSDFQTGAKIGTAVGVGAKSVINHEALTAAQLQALADAARAAGR